MQNITIIINNFSQVSEYLYDEYLEYIKRIKIKFINANLELFLETIIQNDQLELLKYILSKCKYKKISTYDVNNLLIHYKGKNHPEEILKILLNKFSDLESYLLKTEGNFRDMVLNSSFEFIKQIYKLKEKTIKNIFRIHIYLIKLYNFNDKRVFYWLLDNELININYDLTDWLIEELNSSLSDINKENIEYLLEKINFNKSELKKIFIVKKGFYSWEQDQYVFCELLVNKKYDLMYYFFELLKPEEIINKDEIELILEYLIKYSNYEMFIFVIKHIINLKYFDFINNEPFIIKYFNIDTDERIVYELVKLGCKIDKNSKNYNYFKNITIENKL